MVLTLFLFRANCQIDNSHTFLAQITFLPPANVVCEGYVFYRCVSVHGGGRGGAIPTCIAGGIPACLAAGGCYPSMHCRWYPSMPSRGGSPPGGVPGPGVSAPGGVCSQGGVAFCCGLLLRPSGLVHSVEGGLLLKVVLTLFLFHANCQIDNSHMFLAQITFLPPANCEGYVFTGVCLSTGRGAIPACIAGGIPACLAAGGAIPACIVGGIPAYLPGGCLVQGCLLLGVSTLLLWPSVMAFWFGAFC